ncbi:hypothetical protein OKW42_008143 [Paraburkholderia sp. WC7.3d]
MQVVHLHPFGGSLDNRPLSRATGIRSTCFLAPDNALSRDLLNPLAGASNGSEKYCVTRMTLPLQNSIMLTV